MSEENAEGSQIAACEESDVCVGDGTTCVECGKVFTHPFYFSTHISSHTNQREFVVVGQCALCGLVFSNSATFTAHLSSSQTRLEKQVPPKDDTEAGMSCADGNPEPPSQKDLDIEKTIIKVEVDDTDEPIKKENRQIKKENRQIKKENRQDIKESSPATQTGEATTADKDKESVDTSSNEEPRVKRKRSAPQRFEFDSAPQLASASTTDADPEVEAYLMSLKQMGLTVDPAAFSSNKGGKRRRKTSDGGSKKGKGRKEFSWPGDAGDLPPDFEHQKKPSPKYEYLDSDDSLEEYLEVVPESGKMTRGQRLQQRLERLSQTKDVASGTKKSGHTKTSAKDVVVKEECEIKASASDGENEEKVNKIDEPLTTLDTSTASMKAGKPAHAPPIAVKKENMLAKTSTHISNFISVPSATANSGKNTFHKNLPQPNPKFNMIRAPAGGPHLVGKNNQYRTLPLPNAGNMYQTRPVVNAGNFGQRPLRFQQGGGKVDARFAVQQGGVRGGKGDARFAVQQGGGRGGKGDARFAVQQGGGRGGKGDARFAGTLNVEKSNSLEDLKKNSRDNVEQMLQSIGMMAVTSSAIEQGKIFTAQKVKCGQIAFPPVRGMGSFGLHRPNYPHRELPKRPFNANEVMPSQQLLSYKGQARFSSKPGRGQTGSQAAWVNSINNPRGRQTASPQTFKSGPSMGAFSYPQTVGNVRGVGIHRGRGQHLQNSTRGNIKSGSVSLRGAGKSVVSPAQPVAVSKGKASSTSKQTKSGQGTGDVIVIDDDEIKRDIAENADPLSAEVSQKSSPEYSNNRKVAILDVDLDNSVSNIEIITDNTTKSSSSIYIDMETNDKNKAEESSNQDGDNVLDTKNEANVNLSQSVHKKQKRKSHDPVAESSKTGYRRAIDKNISDDNMNKDTDIKPGDDVGGWKVSLAENPDSNEGSSSVPTKKRKTLSNEDEDLPLPDNSKQSCSPQPNDETIIDNSKQINSFSQNLKPNHSDSSNDSLNQSNSAIPESVTVSHSISKLQSDTRRNNSLIETCSGEDDTHNDNAETTATPSVSASHDPDLLGECGIVDAKLEAVTSKKENLENTVADCENISSEFRNNIHPVSTTYTEEVGGETVQEVGGEAAEDVGAEEAGAKTVEKIGAETAEEAGADTAEEAGADTAEEAGAKIAEESGADTAEEAGAEIAEEAGAEIAEETGVKIAEKAGAEVVEETGAKIAEEAGAEEAGADTAEEVGVETAEEAGAENDTDEKDIPPALVYTSASLSSTKYDSERATEGQEQHLNGTENSSYSITPSPNDTRTFGRKNMISEESGNLEENSTKKKTSVEDNIVKNKRCEIMSVSTVGSCGNPVDDAESPLIHTHVSQKEKTNPILPVSKSETILGNDKTDHCIENSKMPVVNSSTSDCGNDATSGNTESVNDSVSSESPSSQTCAAAPASKILVVNSSTSDCGNDASKSDNTELVKDAASSESPASQTCATAPASFLKDVDSLLDIFTEIEKTCKEMEEAQSSEGDKQSHSPQDRGLNNAHSNIPGNMKQVENKNGNVSSNENINNVGELRDRDNVDNRCSATVAVKEDADTESGTSMNENDEKINEMETDLEKDHYEVKSEMSVKDNSKISPGANCDEEFTQTSDKH